MNFPCPPKLGTLVCSAFVAMEATCEEVNPCWTVGFPEKEGKSPRPLERGEGTGEDKWYTKMAAPIKRPRGFLMSPVRGRCDPRPVEHQQRASEKRRPPQKKNRLCERAGKHEFLLRRSFFFNVLVFTHISKCNAHRCVTSNTMRDRIRDWREMCDIITALKAALEFTFAPRDFFLCKEFC